MSKKDEAAFLKWVDETWLPSLKPELHNSAKALVNDDNARTELMNGYLRQDDYTRKTQELAKEREAAEAALAAKAQYEAEVQDWYQKANLVLQEERAQRAALEAQLNSSNGVKDPQMPNQDELVKQIAALQDHLHKVDRGSYATATALPNLAYRAAKEGYSFDAAKIIEISSTQNLPLETAFEKFIAPEKAERDKEAHLKEIEEIKEQVRREMLSNRTSPDAMGSPMPAAVDHLFNKSDLTNKDTRLNEALKEFYAAGS